MTIGLKIHPGLVTMSYPLIESGSMKARVLQNFDDNKKLSPICMCMYLS